MAQTACYKLRQGQLAIQKLQSEPCSITTFESITDGGEELELSGTATCVSLYFIQENSLELRQCFADLALSAQNSCALVYWPAQAKLCISLPAGRTLILRIDFAKDELSRLSDDFPFLRPLLRAMGHGGTLVRSLPLVAMDAYMRISIQQILEYGQTKSERDLFIYARCLDLLRHYMHSVLQGALETIPTNSIATQVASVRSYIDQHLDSPLSKKRLARVHGISVRSMERYFQQYYHQSVGKYISFARMSKAQELLRETTLPLLTIATMVGFGELSNFARAFKAHFGYQPSRLRS